MPNNPLSSLLLLLLSSLSFTFFYFSVEPIVEFPSRVVGENGSGREKGRKNALNTGTSGFPKFYLSSNPIRPPRKARRPTTRRVLACFSSSEKRCVRRYFTIHRLSSSSYFLFSSFISFQHRPMSREKRRNSNYPGFCPENTTTTTTTMMRRQATTEPSRASRSHPIGFLSLFSFFFLFFLSRFPIFVCSSAKRARNHESYSPLREPKRKKRSEFCERNENTNYDAS